MYLRFANIELLDNSISNFHCLHSCIGGILNDCCPNKYKTVKDVLIDGNGFKTWFLGGLHLLKENNMLIEGYCPSPVKWDLLIRNGLDIFEGPVQERLFQFYGKENVQNIVNSFGGNPKGLKIHNSPIRLHKILGRLHDCDSTYCIVGLDSNTLYNIDNNLISGHYVVIIEITERNIYYRDPNFIRQGILCKNFNDFITSMNNLNGNGGEIYFISHK